MASNGIRMSADERREAAIQAAVTEFGATGYNGTSTGVIAKRIGVSQPYLFRLFPSKKALFLAAAERCFQGIQQHLERVSEGLEGAEAFRAMCMSYGDLIRGSDVLRMQLQMYVASVDDEEVREVCRRGWMELWSYVVARTGIEEGEAAEFFGTGMLVNVLVALGIDEGERCWGGIQQQYGARYPEQAPASAPSPAPN